MKTADTSQRYDLFISYASHDIERVRAIVRRVEEAGISVWRDQDRILGGGNYGQAIIDGIERCKLVLLMCSAASMRSRNVKQEIQLAWHYERAYLPLLLDGTIGHSYPKQIQYWLEGCQWIEVLDRPAEEWLPRILRALEQTSEEPWLGNKALPADSSLAAPIRLADGLAGLGRLASFTDQIWPVELLSPHKPRTLHPGWRRRIPVRFC